MMRPGCQTEIATCGIEHGRIETRQYYHVNVADYPDWLEKAAQFPYIKGIVLNRQTRVFTTGKAAEHHDTATFSRHSSKTLKKRATLFDRTGASKIKCTGS